MPRDIPAVRIFPMSDKIEGFRGRGIEDVQARVFLRMLPKRKGLYQYISSGLKAEPGTVVLFQYRAHIVASAIFIRDEKTKRPIGTARGGVGGYLHFEPESFRTFDPLDVDAMRKVWERFRGFGHVKQFLNPELYPLFKRRLRNVKSAAG